MKAGDLASQIRVAQQGCGVLIAGAGDGQSAGVRCAAGAVVGGGQGEPRCGGEVGVGKQVGRPADDGFVDPGAPGVFRFFHRVVGSTERVQPVGASGAQLVQQLENRGVAQRGGDDGRLPCLGFGRA